MSAEKQQRLRVQLETELPHFTGSETWHNLRYPWLRKQFLLTDGVKYLTETAQCYWLMDVIASHFAHRRVMAEPFQLWTLNVDLEKSSAQITAEDGNGKLLARQAIPHTDFPLDEIKLYVTNDEYNGIVVMLTSEY